MLTYMFHRISTKTRDISKIYRRKYWFYSILWSEVVKLRNDSRLCSIFEPTNDSALSFYLTLLQKKSSVLRAIPIDSGIWRPIKQSLIRRFFVSRHEGIFWPFEVSAFLRYYFLICDGFNENYWNSRSLLILSRRAPRFFSEFFIHIYAQKWGSKGQKTWFKKFSNWKTRDLSRPEVRECGLEFFLGVLSHIRCNPWGSKLVHCLERR